MGPVIGLRLRQMQRARHRAPAFALRTSGLPVPLERLPYGAPILRGRFHHHFLDLLCDQPGGQLAQLVRTRPHHPPRELVLTLDRYIGDDDGEQALVDINSRNLIWHRSLLAGAENVPIAVSVRVSGCRRAHSTRQPTPTYSRKHARSGSSN